MEILISLIQLGEAELRALKCGIMRMFAGVLFQLVGVCIAMIGVGLLITAMFAALIKCLGVPIGALITGGGVLLLAFIILGVASWRSR